jgi:hypothetical protein
MFGLVLVVMDWEAVVGLCGGCQRTGEAFRWPMRPVLRTQLSSVAIVLFTWSISPFPLLSLPHPV